MKVVQIVPGIDVEASGPSYSVPGLCRGLSENDVNVVLYTRAPCNLKPQMFHVMAFPWSRVFPLKTIRWISGMLSGLKSEASTADLFHSNGLWMMPNVYPLWAIRGTKCKLVVSPRGALAEWALKLSWLKKKIFWHLFQKKVLDRADMFHATSMKEYEEIRACGYKQPVAIVPIGMDMPSCAEKQSKVGAMHTVAFFGRIHKVKAVDRLVKAWGRVATRHPNWELVVAGPDCGAKPELEKCITAEKVPRVRFVGELNGKAKYDFLASSDLYVLPSFTENFGITVAEALACGTPVIVSKGTPWEGVVSNNCGWWVDNDPGTLARALESAIGMPDGERMAMGMRGREWIGRDFSWAGVGSKMKAAYSWLLGEGEKPEFVVED